MPIWEKIEYRNRQGCCNNFYGSHQLSVTFQHGLKNVGEVCGNFKCPWSLPQYSNRRIHYYFVTGVVGKISNVNLPSSIY